MKKSISKAVCGMLVCVALGLTGCGEDEKTIGGSTPQSTSQQTAETAAQAQDDQTEAVAETVTGYYFQSGEVQIAPNMDMAGILAALGESSSYYEAASCAFEGLDKIYTYSGFEIDTYPRGEKDCISSVILKDDTVSTVEGISIGASEESVREAYGEPDEDAEGTLVYLKEDTKLVFVVNGGSVASIEYNSTVLDE